ncbi:MAG TPA: ATPase domain-containing protein, partial [Methanomassiliicoccales archaeon]|nr:ATPase domain-containing protein [Methanomassiliicoccales archaeon]
TVVDMVALRRSTEDQPGDWRSILLRYVRNVHENHPIKMFVLDSLASFKSITSLDFGRQDLKDLFDWFKDLDITVFLIAEAPSDHSEMAAQEAYLADGVIELTLKELDDTRVQRWVRVPKMRGANTDTRYHAMFHKDGHFVLTVPMVETERRF